MYKKVLVPLDGSELAQCTLNELENVIGDGSEVILFRVVETLNSFVVDANIQAEAAGLDLTKFERKNEESARNYLERIAARLKKKGIAVKTAVTRGKPADMIKEYASKNNVDLIVISTHGHSGVTRWAYGSVADKVLRTSTVPVLLVTPKGCRLS